MKKINNSSISLRIEEQIKNVNKLIERIERKRKTIGELIFSIGINIFKLY